MNQLKFLIQQATAGLYLKRKASNSLSNNQAYSNFCLKASNDMAVFSTFRQHPVYRSLQDHVSPKHAQAYLNEILKYPALSGHWDAFKKNEEWGSPKLKRYFKIGPISAATLRYIKVLNDLRLNFGNLNNLKIAEIGVGYGGQCRIINSIYKPKKYTLVDIKPALMLAQRYLDNYVLHATLEYKTMNELEAARYDLVISNYAFTELPRVMQDIYLKRVILNSAGGYITYHENDMENFHSYKKEDLVKIIPGARIMDEVPLTAPGNCIIVWGAGVKTVLNGIQPETVKEEMITA